MNPKEQNKIYAKIAIQADDKGVRFRKKLTNCPASTLAELIVAIEILLDQLKDKYKGTMSVMEN